MTSAFRLVSAALLTVAFLATANTAHSQTSWTGGTSAWGTASNWDNGVPTSATAVSFNNVGATSVNLGGVSRDLQSLTYNFGASGFTLSGNAGDKLNFAPGGFINSSAGIIGAETINSAIGLNGGAFTITNDEPSKLLTLNGEISLTSGVADVLTVNGAGNTTINGSIALGALAASATTYGLTMSGTGTLTLGGNNSAYSGGVTISGGTVVASADNSLGSGPVWFGLGDGSANTGNLIVNGNQTINNLGAQTNSTTPNVLTINSGKTLTVTASTSPNALWVGAIGGSINATTILNVTGSGTLAVNDATRNIVVCQYTNSSGILNPVTLDMSGLSTFNGNVANIYVGRPTLGGGGATTGYPSDTLMLANSNTITVSGKIAMGGTSANVGGEMGTIRLGTANTINAGQWIVGNSRTSGAVNFNDGLTNPNVTINGASGAGTRTNITLGDQNNATATGGGGGSTITTGTMDLSAGTVNALVDNFVIGNGAGAASSNRGQGNGVFTFGGSTSNVNVNTLIIARDRSDTTATTTPGVSSTGTMTMNGGALVVNNSFIVCQDIDASATGGQQDLNGTFTMNGGTASVGSVGTPVNMLLGNRTGSAVGTLTPIVNLNGGALTVNGNLALGSTTGTVNATVNLSGGALDMTGHNIGANGALVTNLNFQAGTLSNVAQINDGAGLTKTSPGVLNVTGANTFTGTVTVNEGTLNFQPTATHNLSGGNLTVGNSTTLGVATFSTSSSAVVTSGALALGSSSGSTLNFTLAGNSAAAAAALNVGAFSTAGTSTVNVGATAPLSVGQFPLIDYTGSIGGTGFAGLTLGTLPPRTLATLVNNAGNTSVDLKVTGTDTIRWNGNVNSVWDINTTSNWKEIISGNATKYLQPGATGETVTFDDNAAGTTSVNVSTAVSPASVTFNNSTKAYTLSGTGDLTTGTLTKTGTNTATISTSGALSISTIALNGAGALVINRTDSPTLSSTLTGSGTLRKAGTNSLTLSGSSAGFTGTVDVTTGTLKLGSSNALGTSTTNIAGGTTLDLNGNTLSVGTGAVTLTGSGVITAASTGLLNLVSSQAIANNITGGVGVSVTGSGTAVTLSGSNTYSGGTTLVGSTLTLGANNAAGSGALTFGDGSTSAIGNLNLGAFNQTSSSLTAQSNTATANTITIGSGKSLTLSGGAAANVITVGGLGSVIPVTRLNVTGAGGTLAVSDPTHNIVVSQLGPSDDIGGLSPATLDLSGLGTFNATVANVYVARPTDSSGAASGSAVSDTLLLANQNDVTVSGNIAIGGTSLSVGGETGTLRLGTTNTIKAGQWIVGNGRVSGTVNFNDGLTNPTASLYGAGGSLTRTNIVLGDQGNQTGVGAGGGSTSTTGTMDFTGGTITASIDNLTVGNGGDPNTANGRGMGNGVFTFGGASSSVDVNTLTIGATKSDNTVTNNSGGTGRLASDSSVNVNGGTLVVNTAVTIANDRDTSNTTGGTGGVQDVSGAMNINGGTATVGSTTTPADIVLGQHVDGGNSGVATATINVNGGSLTAHGAILQGALGSGTTTSTINVNAGTLATDGAITTGTGGGAGLGVVNVGSGPALTMDYNSNGVVDAADYVLWRKSPASHGGTPAGYNAWRSNFGATGGGAPGVLTVGGTMSVDTLNLNSGTVNSVGDVSIATALTGNGTINGNVLMGFLGNVSPGVASTGKLTISNNHNLTLSSGGTLTMDINGTTPVTDYDQLNATGLLAVDGILQVNLGFTPVGGTQFDLLDFGSITGVFSSVNFSAGTWDQSALYTTGIVKYLSAGSGSGIGSGTGVPEPASCGLFLCAVLGLLSTGRRPRLVGATK